MGHEKRSTFKPLNMKAECLGSRQTIAFIIEKNEWGQHQATSTLRQGSHAIHFEKKVGFAVVTKEYENLKLDLAMSGSTDHHMWTSIWFRHRRTIKHELPDRRNTHIQRLPARPKCPIVPVTPPSLDRSLTRDPQRTPFCRYRPRPRLRHILLIDSQLTKSRLGKVPCGHTIVHGTVAQVATSFAGGGADVVGRCDNFRLVLMDDLEFDCRKGITGWDD